MHKEAMKLTVHKKVDIKRIEIRSHLGTVLKIDGPDVVMNQRQFSVFSRSVDIVLGDKAQRESMCKEARIIASVKLDCLYSIEATSESFTALNDSGELCTEHYLDLVEESEEGFYIRHFEEYKKETYPHKLKNYRTFVDEELDEFADKTDGVGVTRGFRNYMASFIRTFKPELLVKGKPYILLLNKRGEFCVENIYCPGERALLSENEETIYHYLCYLQLSKFWSSVECMKNQNHLALPLIVDGFLDRLDESMDKNALIDKALNLNRQAFFSSSVAS